MEQPTVYARVSDIKTKFNFSSDTPSTYLSYMDKFKSLRNNKNSYISRLTQLFTVGFIEILITLASISYITKFVWISSTEIFHNEHSLNCTSLGMYYTAASKDERIFKIVLRLY